MAAYATSADLIARYDIDIIGDLASDEREPMERDDVPNHPNVLVKLLDASGEIDVALLSGSRYTPQQLENLTGNSKYKLIRITCDIAMSLLLSRRADERLQDLAENVAKISRQHLAALQRGENVFGIVEMQGAGTIELATVSSVEVDQRNLLPSRCPNFFPGSQQRSPLRYG
jgi:phage gp36-like protein